jgi:hypothetical protein
MKSLEGSAKKMADLVTEILDGFEPVEREVRLKALIEGAEQLSCSNSAPRIAPRGTSSNSSREPHASRIPVLAKGYGR